MKHLLISSPKANTQTHFSSSLENLELFYLLSLKSFSLLLLLLFLPPTIGGGAVLLDYFYDFDKAVKAPPNFFCFFVKGTLNRYVMAFWSKYEKGHSHTQRSSFIIASLKPSLWSLIYGRNQARNQTITQPIFSTWIGYIHLVSKSFFKDEVRLELMSVLDKHLEKWTKWAFLLFKDLNITNSDKPGHGFLICIKSGSSTTTYISPW